MIDTLLGVSLTLLGVFLTLLAALLIPVMRRGGVMGAFVVGVVSGAGIALTVVSAVQAWSA